MDLLVLFAAFLPMAIANCPATNYTQSEGTINSPDDNGKYPKTAQSCSYDIRVPSGRRAKLSFTKFNVLGAMPGCSEASFEVFVSCDDKRPVGKFCSCGLTAGKPFDIYSFDECISVIFKSNGKAQGAGFAATYSSKPKNMAAFASSECSNVNASGNFYSPHWPLNYPNDTNCNWTLTIPKDNNALISFMSFNMEKSSVCNQQSKADDHVGITGIKHGKSEYIKKRWCSRQLDEDISKIYNVTKFSSVNVEIFGDSDAITASGIVGGFSSYRTDAVLDTTNGKCATEKPMPGQTASLVSSLVLIVVAAVLSYEWPALN